MNKSDKELYNNFISTTELQAIRLDAGSFKVERDELLTSRETNIQITSKGKHRIKDQLLCFELSYVIRAMGAAEKELMVIKIEYIVEFFVPSTPKTTVIKEFQKLVVINIVWPYVREYVSNLTKRMDLPPLLLPLSKISPASVSEK